MEGYQAGRQVQHKHLMQAITTAAAPRKSEYAAVFKRADISGLHDFMTSYKEGRFDKMDSGQMSTEDANALVDALAAAFVAAGAGGAASPLAGLDDAAASLLALLG